MSQNSYTQEIKLQHNEKIAVINQETGEMRDVRKRINNIPPDKEVFEPTALFRKDYIKSWEYLKDKLTPLQFKAAYSMALLAKANTNSLEPLNSDTTLKELSDTLGVSKNKISDVLDVLAYHGVYGEFKIIKEEDPKWKKFWILNPYLSFSGKLITSDIATLFIGTRVTNAFFKDI